MHSSIYYVFHYYLAPTFFGAVAILREFRPMLLKRTATQQFYNDHAFRMCRFNMHVLLNHIAAFALID